MRKEVKGLSIDEYQDICANMKPHDRHYKTVDDIRYVTLEYANSIISKQDKTIAELEAKLAVYKDGSINEIECRTLNDAADDYIKNHEGFVSVESVAAWLLIRSFPSDEDGK